MTDDERRAFENLILVCAECHDKIDDTELKQDYDCDRLTRWKEEHEDNSWMPADHIEAWGKIIIQEGGEQIELPYFRTDGDLRFFSEEQWATVEAAFWIYVEIVEVVDALFGAHTMNQTYIESGDINRNSITNNVARQFAPSPTAKRLLPTAEDPTVYNSPASRIFSLMKGAQLTLDQTLWLATNPQTTIVAISIDSAGDIE